MVGDILQPTHLLFILVIALLVLGPKRLPEVGKSLGRGLRDFRGALNGDSDDDQPGGFMSQATETAPVAATAAAEAAPVAPAPPEPVGAAAATTSMPVETGQPADTAS